MYRNFQNLSSLSRFSIERLRIINDREISIKAKIAEKPLNCADLKVLKNDAKNCIKLLSQLTHYICSYFHNSQMINPYCNTILEMIESFQSMIKSLDVEIATLKNNNNQHQQLEKLNAENLAKPTVASSTFAFSSQNKKILQENGLDEKKLNKLAGDAAKCISDKLSSTENSQLNPLHSAVTNHYQQVSEQCTDQIQLLNQYEHSFSALQKELTELKRDFEIQKQSSQLQINTLKEQISSSQNQIKALSEENFILKNKLPTENQKEHGMRAFFKRN